jgi:hypothetical protein
LFVSKKSNGLGVSGRQYAFIAFISDVPVIFYCATTCVIDVSFISFFLESKYPCMCSLDIAGMNNVPAWVL